MHAQSMGSIRFTITGRFALVSRVVSQPAWVQDMEGDKLDLASVLAPMRFTLILLGLILTVHARTCQIRNRLPHTDYVPALRVHSRMQHNTSELDVLTRLPSSDYRSPRLTCRWVIHSACFSPWPGEPSHVARKSCIYCSCCVPDPGHSSGYGTLLCTMRFLTGFSGDEVDW